jgi:LCP family protein required for cell wall assembly
MAEPPYRRRPASPSQGRQPWETSSRGGSADGRGNGAPRGRGAPGGARQSRPEAGKTGGARAGAAGGGPGISYGAAPGAGRKAGGARQPGAAGAGSRGRGNGYGPQGAGGTAPREQGDRYGATGGRGRPPGAGVDADPSRGRRPRRAGPQRLLLILGAVLVLFCVTAASLAGYALVKLESIARVNDLDTASAAAGEPENFLVVAIDTREGQSSVNTDTMMVVRVDPASDRVALTSFPRDLMVTIADTGEIGMLNSAYNRPERGEQNLINTLRQNFDIEINHFIEVNFESFREVVDAVGGIPIYIPYPMRDRQSGLYQYDLGCRVLDGEQGLAFARARHFEILTGSHWQTDPSADIGRVQRQQIFIRLALSKALAEVKSSPWRLPDLVDIGVANVRLDANLALGDLLDLARHFEDFDANNLEAYALPVKEYPQDPNRLLLDEAPAEQYLNVFRGLAQGEVRPGVIDVSVLNGTDGQNPTLAGDVSGALKQIGFKLEAPQDADELYDHTVIFHAPGEAAYGQRLARHITVPVELREDPDLEPAHVRLVAGTDFTTVHEDPAPVESVTPAAPADASGTTAATTATTTATTVPPPTTTTEPTGFQVGIPPDGETC